MTNLMKKRFLLLAVFFLITGCNTTYVTYSDAKIPVKEALVWNDRVKIKTTDIHLKNGEVLKNKITRIRSTEVIYVDKGKELTDYRSVPLSAVKEIRINPQINSNFYVGLSLLGIAGYLVYDDLRSTTNETGTTGISDIAIPFTIGIGSSYFFYKGLETETTILKFDE